MSRGWRRAVRAGPGRGAGHGGAGGERRPRGGRAPAAAPRTQGRRGLAPGGGTRGAQPRVRDPGGAEAKAALCARLRVAAVRGWEPAVKVPAEN